MKFDAVIFDIDNVLVDTQASYTDCIRKTVNEYLKTILGYAPSRSLIFSREDVEQFKSFGGFNDDWDTCYGLLLYAISLKIPRRAIREIVKQKDINAFSQEISQKPLGITGIEKLLGKNPGVTINRIEQIFQALYRNELIWNEKLIVPRTCLADFKQNNIKTGIVTGRSREEALIALKRFRVEPLFDAMVTIDETPAGRKKPDPYGLLKVTKILGENLNFLYVGDLPDDMLAAEAAKKNLNIKSCGFTAVSTQPDEMSRQLKNAGADFICCNVEELKKLITQ